MEHLVIYGDEFSPFLFFLHFSLAPRPSSRFFFLLLSILHWLYSKKYRHIFSVCFLLLFILPCNTWIHMNAESCSVWFSLSFFLSIFKKSSLLNVLLSFKDAEKHFLYNALIFSFFSVRLPKITDNLYIFPPFLIFHKGPRG